jgi:hypothetical protein
MTWVRLDPQEMGVMGAHIRDIAVSLQDAARRIDAACCAPGLGRHAGPLMGEGRSLSARVVGVTETYLRQGIDILQRAIAAVQDSQLVSTVGGTGSISAGIIGATTVGGTLLTSGTVSMGMGTMTLGGFSLTDGITIGGTGSMTIGGTGFVGGGSGMAGGIMALAGAAQQSQQRQDAIMARLRSGGGGVVSGDPGNQALVDMVNRQSLQRIEDSQIRTAASSPIAGYPQAQAADRTDGGSRARQMDTERFYERKRQGLT